MADGIQIADEKLKERLAQLARAERPFNPVEGVAISGRNLVRIQTAMKQHGWKDMRFVTKAQARANGWKIEPKAPTVETFARDLVNDTTEPVELVNAVNVGGMPTLPAMLLMSSEAIAKMRPAPAKPARATKPAQALEDNAIRIAPARELVQQQAATAKTPAGQVSGQQTAPNTTPSPAVVATGSTPGAAGNASVAGIVGGVVPQVARYAAMAPYWLNGLHNFEGLAQAKEINEVIRAQNLAHDHAAMTRLMAVYPQARDFGIGIVAEDTLLNDPHINANASEPKTLLGGDLVRDPEGMYRPKDGGRPLLHDQGTTVVLKGKGAEAYRGAMELALAKGWTAIELNGKKSMLAEAWLEARMLGLNVVNYTPNEKDKEKFAARLAAESERKVEQTTKEVAPDDIEVRPSSNEQAAQMAAPLEKPAVAHGGQTGGPEFKTLKSFGPARYLHAPTNNQSYFAELVDKHGEVQAIWGLDIERSLAAAGAKVGDSVALVNVGKKPVEVMQPQGDGTFKAVPGERLTWETYIEGRERAGQQQKASVSAGFHVGPVMAIQDGRVAQKTGRDPAQVVWHEIAKLNGATPRLGESVEIGYTNGIGTVSVKGLEQEQAAGQRSIGR